MHRSIRHSRNQLTLALSTTQILVMIGVTAEQWWANPNPDLDLNPDLATFDKSGGFGLDLNIFNTSGLDLAGHLDLTIFKKVDLDWIWVFLKERIWI